MSSLDHRQEFLTKELPMRLLAKQKHLYFEVRNGNQRKKSPILMSTLKERLLSIH